jgi:hypothetical protein
MRNQLAGQVTEQCTAVGSFSAEIVDFVSVTHDIIRLGFTPCQEL